MSEPLMEFTSHIEGRNAKVAIYDDRIEWGRQRITLSGRRLDTNMVPVRQIQGVTNPPRGNALYRREGGDCRRHDRVPRHQGAGRRDQGHHHQADARRECVT